MQFITFKIQYNCQYLPKNMRKYIKTILKVSQIKMFNEKLENCKTILSVPKMEL